MMEIIGHRGAMGYAPENTIKSFQKALELGVDMIELDVAACKTGEVVVIHDDRVDRTTGQQGYVSDLALSQLKSMNAGEGELIPTLEESLDFIHRQVPLNIELKNSQVVEGVVKVLQQNIDSNRWENDDFLISSFDHHALQKFQQLMPSIRIAVLIGIIPISYAEIASQLNAYALNPCLDFINKTLVDDAKKRGLKTYVWTVNHVEDMNKMDALNVDGIFTNYPDRYQKVVNEL